MERAATEAANPASRHVDALDAAGIVRLLNAEDATVPGAVAGAADAVAAAVELVAARLRDGGRLVYVGAGTSGRLGVLDAAECPPTFDTPPGMVAGVIAGGPDALVRAVEGAEDRADAAAEDLDRLGVASGDVVVGIAACGRTPYVLAALRHARRTGAATVALSCTPRAPLSDAADVAIEVPVGPEVITGSTRLKAGTATKLVLNTISTGAMVLLGKTYGNLMVDLRATNAKLRDRACRIVAALTGLDPDAAAALLAAHGGEVKTAVVAHARGTTTTAARDILAAAGGRLRTVLDGAAAPPVAAGGGPPLVVAIDGGGSGCRAVVAADDGAAPRVLGRGEGGPANPRLAGAVTAAANLRVALTAAFAAAGIAPRPALRLVAGIAGTGRSADRRAMESALCPWAAEVEVISDAELVLGDAGPGAVALVAGTGSIAVARGADGVLRRAGGWGPLFGDEGSGHRIAVEGLTAAVRMADGRGPATALADRFLERLAVDSPARLVERIHAPGMSRDRVAALAADVVAVAEGGDGIAAAILARAAAALAELVVPLVARGPGSAPWHLRLSGGLLVGAPAFAAAVVAAIGAAGSPPATVRVVDDPAAEGLRRARPHVSRGGA